MNNWKFTRFGTETMQVRVLPLIQNENEMESKMMKEMCPNQQSDIVQQTLPGRLTGRAREFESRSAGSSPAPATEGAIA